MDGYFPLTPIPTPFIYPSVEGGREREHESSCSNVVGVLSPAVLLGVLSSCSLYLSIPTCMGRGIEIESLSAIHPPFPFAISIPMSPNSNVNVTRTHSQSINCFALMPNADQRIFVFFQKPTPPPICAQSVCVYIHTFIVIGWTQVKFLSIPLVPVSSTTFVYVATPSN
jgi:hypothetical protein